MSEQLVTAVVTVATAIIGVAILAVLVSKNSQTVAVTNAAATGFSNVLGTALSPVSGGSRIGGISFSGGGNLPTISF